MALSQQLPPPTSTVWIPHTPHRTLGPAPQPDATFVEQQVEVAKVAHWLRADGERLRLGVTLGTREHSLVAFRGNH